MYIVAVCETFGTVSSRTIDITEAELDLTWCEDYYRAILRMIPRLSVSDAKFLATGYDTETE